MSPFDARAAVRRTTPKPEAAPVIEQRTALSVAHQQATETKGLASQLSQEVRALVIENAEDYLAADELLGRIRGARKVWGGIWERIQDKTIKPIRAGLDELYSLNREVDKPMEQLEDAVKAKQKAFKLEETRQLREVEEQRAAELHRIELERQKKDAQIEQAKTAGMRERLRAARENLEQEAAQVASADAPAPVQGTSSTARIIQKARIVDFAAACRGAADGIIPSTFVTFDTNAIEKLAKLTPDAVRKYPGVELYDDVQIVGR